MSKPSTPMTALSISEVTTWFKSAQ